MIRCESLTVRYPSGSTALDGITLTIGKGEMAGILGPNGSGKTTLLRAIAGSLSPVTGGTRCDGKPVLSLSARERARMMAFVPQRPETIPDFTVFDMALMGRYPHRDFLEDYTGEDKKITLRCLEETAVGHLADRPARSLSGGELQRAYVARAFAQDTAVLLLDEAATGLDPAHAMAVFGHVRRRNKEREVTVLAAIHDLNLAALFCDRLIFLRKGEIIGDGPTREVFTPPMLESVYAAPFLVLDHPVLGLPQAMMLPRPSKEYPHA